MPTKCIVGMTRMLVDVRPALGCVAVPWWASWELSSPPTAHVHYQISTITTSVNRPGGAYSMKTCVKVGVPRGYYGHAQPIKVLGA